MSQVGEEVMRVGMGGGVSIFGFEKSVGRARREMLLSDEAELQETMNALRRIFNCRKEIE